MAVGATICDYCSNYMFEFLYALKVYITANKYINCIKFRKNQVILSLQSIIDAFLSVTSDHSILILFYNIDGLYKV